MVLDGQLQATAHIFHMLSWVGQAIIVVLTYVHGKVVLKDSNVQYMFGQGRNPPLMGAINIPLGMLIFLGVLMHRLFPDFFLCWALRSLEGLA